MQKPGPVSLPSRLSPNASSNEARIRDAARALGFDATGFARADVALEEDFRRYESFVLGGMHGEMAWLAENREVRERVDTDRILKGARTVVCVARRYDRKKEDEAQDPPFAKSIARYARGQDYHNTVRKKLRKLAAFVRGLGTDDMPVEARPICDDAPVLERAWAARAGLGFVGKNGLIIIPGQGSFVLLGEIVTTLLLTPDPPMTDRCGSCTKCLDACPTDAFASARVLDPRKCISYLTIEHRGETPEPLREKIGAHVFGCDDCQSVCPFNGGKNVHAAGNLNVFSPHSRWAETTLKELVLLDEKSFGPLSEGSPLRRATKDGLVRNAAIVLGNTGDPHDLDTRNALLRVAESHDEKGAQEAAAWALKKLAARAHEPHEPSENEEQKKL